MMLFFILKCWHLIYFIASHVFHDLSNLALLLKVAKEVNPTPSEHEITKHVVFEILII